ncbi:MAG: lipooligosaccharide transport system ATP-binding protein [Gammaproteobacteria bacterium]|jgi:lipooligosaccharide transport system ATP-binding protein
MISQPESAKAAVSARGLTKSFGDTMVVKGIDFDVPQGRCFGILGPNGAGKTTTLRMLLGQAIPSAGELTVLGHAVPNARRAARRRIGVVPQLDNLDPDFTVVENLYVYASYFGMSRAVVRSRVDEILELVVLTARANSPISALSGGMKRRLSIARALVNDPDLLVLDEPTTGLDPQVRHLIWSRLRELAREGKTLLLTTHYMEEAQRLCDEIIVMDGGRIVAQGSPASLIREHVEAHVVEVNGEDPSLRSLVEGITGVRVESIDETLYCYTANPDPLLRALEANPLATSLRRPSNLEDVFLHLTGRDLRE